MKLKKFIQASKMKPLDGIIISFLFLISFLPLLLFSLQQKNQSADVTYQAVLSVNGEEIKTFDLSKGDTYRYETKDGDYNLIEIKDGAIAITDANCGDLVCVRRGWIKKSGETIVCLPHKLLIEIKASDGSQEGNVIY